MPGKVDSPFGQKNGAVGSLFKKKPEEPEAPPEPEYSGNPVADLKGHAIKAFKLQPPFTGRIVDTCAINKFPISDDHRAAVDLEQACLLWIALIQSSNTRLMPREQLYGSLTQALEEALAALGKEFWLVWLQRGADWIARERQENELEERWEELGIPFEKPKVQGRLRRFHVQILYRMHSGFEGIFRDGYMVQERIEAASRPVIDRLFLPEERPLDQSEVIENFILPVIQRTLDGRIPE